VILSGCTLINPSITHQTEFRLWLSSNWLISRI